MKNVNPPSRWPHQRSGGTRKLAHHPEWRCRDMVGTALARLWPPYQLRLSGMKAAPSARRFEPLFGEQPHRGVRVHRLAEGKALRVFAAQLVELDRVRVGLGALGNDVHAEVVGESDDRFQDHWTRPALRGADKGLVDLQRIEREALQIGQRGVAGAEIVDREPDAE